MDKILGGQFIINGGLKLAQLVLPGIDPRANLAKAQLLVDMLRPCVLKIGVQNNLAVARLLKEMAGEQAQKPGAVAFALLLEKSQILIPICAVPSPRSR
jgi:hypothetical protein